MDLVTGALGKLPSKVLELLKDEYKLQTGVKDRIRSGARELESMHAVLRKVAQVPPHELDELVLLWARDVREASYDMEDILDTFLVRVDRGANKEPPNEDKVDKELIFGVNIHELIFGTRRAVFTKIESQQGPKERTFLAGLREEVIVESGGNPLNFSRDNLLNSILGFLPAHLSKAAGCVKFSVRNLFGSLAFALQRLKGPCFHGLNARGCRIISNQEASLGRSSSWSS
jgi:hypothetical protein